MMKHKALAETSTAPPPSILDDMGWDSSPLESVERPELPRIKISRETRMFLVDGVDAPTKRIEGAILKVANVRGYWLESYDKGGGHDAPVCWAVNAPSPAAGSPAPQAKSCRVCPWDRFGSATVGQGKACRERKRLLVLLAGSPLPYLLDVPPMGMRGVDRFLTHYLVAATRVGRCMPLPMTSVAITLREVRSRSGNTSTEPVIEILDVPWQLHDEDPMEFTRLALERRALEDQAAQFLLRVEREAESADSVGEGEVLDF